MKVLEAQSAILTNFEVQQHLSEQRDKYEKQGKRRGPSNYENIIPQVLIHFQHGINPLNQTPAQYNQTTLAQLLERLKPYKLSKAEIITILNIHPASYPILNIVIEDMEERFTEDQQGEIMNIITEVLGEFEPRKDVLEVAGGDVSMDEGNTS